MTAKDILSQALNEVAKDAGWEDWKSVEAYSQEARDLLFFKASLLAMERIAEMSLSKGIEIGRDYSQGEVTNKSTYMNNLFPKI